MLISTGARKQWQVLLHISRSRWKRIICAFAIFYTLLLYNRQKHPFAAHPHAIKASDIDYEASHRPDPAKDLEQHGFIPLEDAKQLCKENLWKPYPHRAVRRKVYDLLMVNDEMDWLEIRLHTLASTVDYFVIMESPFTFTGREKPLVLKENWDRFKEFHNKIIYHVLENPPIGSTRTWDYEDFQRNAMFLQTFPGMQGSQEAQLGDIVIVSDVDEIPRPATLMLLRNCDVPRRITIRSRFYYYGFQNLHIGEEWAHPQATIFGGLGKGETVLPADLRNGEGGNRLKGWWDKQDLYNAGWHCSTCFETVEQVLTKMSSFSHTGLNQEQYREPTRIVDRVRKGKDLWDREGESYQRIDVNEDIPKYLKADRERWSYLLNRDGPNAGFKDYADGYTPGE